MFQVTHTLHERHIADLLRLYRGEWWSRDRREADVRRMLAATGVLVGLVDEDGGLVAFARALTDSVYKAFVFDVIVAPAHRGAGLGRALVEALFAHPGLQAVEHLELYCRPEHVAFYERWGFERAPAELCFMRCSRPPELPAVP